MSDTKTALNLFLMTVTCPRRMDKNKRLESERERGKRCRSGRCDFYLKQCCPLYVPRLHTGHFKIDN